MLRVAKAIAAGSRDEDRLGVFDLGGRWVLVLADGAGGRGGGREAAEAVVAGISSRAADLARSADPATCVAVLEALDQELSTAAHGGETTAVLAVVRDEQVLGASVGDSGAWVLARQAVVDLTRGQVRKPLLGCGQAVVVPFGPFALQGEARLLIASDGLLKYAPRERIQQAAAGPLSQAARSAVDCVRLPSGTLQDDTSVILCGHLES